MGRKTEIAYEEVRKSTFIWHDDRTLEVQDAVILWPNFSGRTNKFGNSARTFNLVVTEEVAEKMTAAGWRVRTISLQNIVDENDKPVNLYFVNIKTNMDSAYPPIVTLFTKFKGKKSRRVLDINTIGELDSVDIEMADCLINCYESRNFPGRITGYLKKLNVKQSEEVEFGGKYDDWMDEELGSCDDSASTDPFSNDSF